MTYLDFIEVPMRWMDKRSESTTCYLSLRFIYLHQLFPDGLV